MTDKIKQDNNQTDEKYIKGIPLNTDIDGTSRPIKAQYYKNGLANFVRSDSFGATGVIDIYEVGD